MDQRVGYVIAAHRDEEQADAAHDSIRALVPDAPIVTVYDHDSTGYGATLNRGVGMLDPVEIVCCLNSDVLMTERDDNVISAFDRDPSVIIVGPRQLDREGRIVHGGIIPDVDSDPDANEWSMTLRHRYWHAKPSENPAAAEDTGIQTLVPMVAGSVFYIRSWALRGLGGWPEWTRFYYEDKFLCYAARLRYGRVLYDGTTTWTHFHEGGADLDRAERIAMMTIARENFIYECGRYGIPLRLPRQPTLT